MASFGCNTTRMPMHSVGAHLSSEVSQHMELMCSAIVHLQNENLRQERRFEEALRLQRESHAALVNDLKGEILVARAISERQQDALREVAAEFRVLWEELDAVKKQKGS
jgi:hypothetical protein